MRLVSEVPYWCNSINNKIMSHVVHGGWNKFFVQHILLIILSTVVDDVFFTSLYCFLSWRIWTHVADIHHIYSSHLSLTAHVTGLIRLSVTMSSLLAKLKHSHWSLHWEQAARLRLEATREQKEAVSSALKVVKRWIGSVHAAQGSALLWETLRLQLDIYKELKPAAFHLWDPTD